MSNYLISHYAINKSVEEDGTIVCTAASALTTWRVKADKHGKTYQYDVISNSSLQSEYPCYTSHTGPVRASRELIKYFNLECDLI